MARKKQCTSCHSVDLAPGRTTLTRQLAGVQYNIELPALICAHCQQTRLSEDIVDHYEKVLAQQVSQGPVGADAMKFLRKWSDVTALELANLLGTTPETVSRWENDVHPVNQAVFWVIARIAQDKLADHSQTLDSLKHHQAIQQAPPRLIELSIPSN